MAGKTEPAKKKVFIQAYKASLFNISKACIAAGIARKTYYNWLAADKKFAEQLEEAKQERKDFAENQLFMLARGVPKKDKAGKFTGWEEKPNPAAVIFLNKTINKDRGYVERIEHEVNVPEETIDISKLSTEEQKAYLKLVRKATSDKAKKADK